MKFAYLIMAHNNKDQLMKLIGLLDDVNNDIYLHLDKKSDLEVETFQNLTKRANIYVFKKIDVLWGNDTIARVALFLLQQAVGVYHDYYHLISGQDLPLKSNRAISDFFSSNFGKEFVHFESHSCCQKSHCKYYNFFYTKIHIIYPLRRTT